MTLSILKLIGGLALFLYGMDLASEGLQKFAAQRIRAVLNLMTRSRLWSLILGAVATLTLQSSSATSVILVTFVNSSLLRLDHALAIVLGADIGTTLTVQILAFHLSDFVLVGVAFGFLLGRLAKSERIRYLGDGIIGFSLVFYGMSLMEVAVEPLRQASGIAQSLDWIKSSVILSLMSSILFTGIIQASAATIVIVMALAHQGVLTPDQAIPFVLGANVGTCATALLASFGRGRGAWRMALGHLATKSIGVMTFLSILPWFSGIVQWATQHFSIGGFYEARFVANVHTFFNLGMAVLLLPFTKVLAIGLEKIIPIKMRPEPFNLEKEGLAGVERGLDDMTRRTGDVLRNILTAGCNNDDRAIRRIIRSGEEIELMGAYFIRYLAEHSDPLHLALTQAQTKKFFYRLDFLLHVNRIVSKDMAALGKEKIRRDWEFSIEGQAQLEQFHRMVYNLYEKTVVQNLGADELRDILDRGETIKKMKEKIYFSHVERLRKALKETQETSMMHLDFIVHLEQISQFTVDFAKGVTQ